MKRWWSSCLLVAGLLCACSSTDSRDASEISNRKSPLSGAGALPVPCDGWNGSAVDLAIADALASCSGDPNGGLEAYIANGGGEVRDGYLTYIRGLMMAAANGLTSNFVQRWINLRADPQLNCDPTTGKSGTAAKIERKVVPGWITVTGSPQPVVNAIRQLRSPGFQLCIAQTLRTMAPGTAGSEALLLSEADQRLLLETIRERAQLAMIDYALLGMLFSHQHSTDPLPTSNNRRTRYLPWLERWALTDGQVQNPPSDAYSPRLAAMGRDFAAAVQLHVTVTEELASLLARSSSARTPRDGTTATRAEELRGAGSWHQRLMAAMLGGDPLANISPGPWPRPDTSGTTGNQFFFNVPGPMLASGVSTSPGLDWPSVMQTPYVTTDMSVPQAWELFALARAFDRIQLTLAPPNASACAGYDLTASADDLYRWVEAEVRRQQCYGPENQIGGQCCTLALCGPVQTKPTNAYPDEKYLLWDMYRIQPEHARTLVRYLADNLDYKTLGASPEGYCTSPAANPDARAGGQLSRGYLGFRDDPSTTGRKWLVLSGQAPQGPSHLNAQPIEPGFDSRPLEDLAPAFSRNAVRRFPAPWELDTRAPANLQGFLGDCWTEPGCAESSQEAKRLMGSAAALSAVRFLLVSAGAYYLQGPGTLEKTRVLDYYKHGFDILKMIDSAIGGESVEFRPRVESAYANGSWTVRVPSTIFSFRDWSVDVTFPVGDEFWDQEGATYYVCALSDPKVGNLALMRGSRFFEESILTLVPDPAMHPRCVGGLMWNDPANVFQIDSLYPGAPRGWSSQRLGLTTATDQYYTLVAARKAGTSSVAYKLLGSSFYIPNSGAVTHAQYFATGGTLGGLLSRAILGKRHNPVEPAYDGFGLPTDWVPPFTAELLGGSADQTSVQRYVDLAKASTDEATAAVAKAMDNMIQEESDDASRAAATERWQAGMKEEVERLCGASNTGCEYAMVKCEPTSCFPSLRPAQILPDFCNPSSSEYDVNRAAECLALGIGNSALNLDRMVPEPVYAQIKYSGVPSFPEYSGGTLQGAFLEDWRAIRKVDTALKLLYQTAETVVSHVQAAAAAVHQAGALAEYECNPGMLGAAMQAGISWNCGQVAALDLGIRCADQQSMGFSWGPYLAQQQKCAEAMNAQEAPAQAAVAALLDAQSAVGSAAAALADAEAEYVKAGVELARLLNESRLARTRLSLEKKLSETGLQTSFGMFRRYRSYDAWRAKALLENSRRYALAARRAIEARYAVNLSNLTTPEAFVQSPSTWADEVYGYDLSLPSAVGLTVGTGNETAGGIYPNKVRDYVSNLEAFVMGYAANRPAAVAKQDIDVVNLRGLKLGSAEEIPGTGMLIYPSLGDWSVRCPGLNGAPAQWVPIPKDAPASQACGGGLSTPGSSPDRARMLFALDPWGRVNQGISNEPFARRYNGRWGLMAVNFVGTGVKNCENAQDPYSCYGEGFVRYNLSHVGPAWVTDYDGLWRELGVPIGRIEGGKGLAAELWLDPLKDGWASSYISAVARTELELRPLGGAYELEFEIGPELDIDRIERVQLLVGSSYWVKQD